MISVGLLTCFHGLWSSSEWLLAQKVGQMFVRAFVLWWFWQQTSVNPACPLIKSILHRFLVVAPKSQVSRIIYSVPKIRLSILIFFVVSNQLKFWLVTDYIKLNAYFYKHFLDLEGFPAYGMTLILVSLII